MFNRAFRSALVACATFGLVLAASEAAEAKGKKEIRQDQVFTGLGLLLDESNADFTLEFKGAPGRATGRTFVKLGPPGPPSAECSGFAVEFPVVGGSLGEIFGDFSKLLALIDSGALCLGAEGAFQGRIAGHYVGGVDFEGASGTFSIDAVGVGLTPGFPASASMSGSITGTIVFE